MDNAEVSRRIASLEARMIRTESLLQQLLLTMMSSQAHMVQTERMQAILQELRGSTANHPVMAGPQERPEIEAIRQALLAGNRLKAIQIYRSLYGVSLKEAQDAIDAM